MSSLRGEAGQVGGVEALAFGLLVFVVGALLVANAWGVIDAKAAVTTAAREGARAYVEAPSGRDASERAGRAARSALEGHGRDPGRATVAVRGRGFARCARVTVEVATRVPAIRLPFIGGFGSGLRVAARHSELVDPYRSGLAGEARCAR